MENPANYRRPPFTSRPWVAGKLYDDLARSTVLHCDAYVFETRALKQLLVIYWREGGKRLVARDAYLIEPDGLTPVWDTDESAHVRPVIWTRANGATFARMHQSVLQLAADAGARFARWSRISLQAHYVRVTDSDVEGFKNAYKPRGSATDAAAVPTMTALLAQPSTVGRKRGRPRKVRQLPDWL